MLDYRRFHTFYSLARSKKAKRKYLYLLGTEHALKFFDGGRALKSVLSKNDKVSEQFFKQYLRVRDYYQEHRQNVRIEDVSEWLPELISDAVAESASDELQLA